MKNHEPHIPIIIIGGGPVGLFLGICLLKRGIKCRILEKRKAPIPDSRSLGIHPISLEIFDPLGITKPFLREGLKIKRGLALSESSKLGVISFKHCPLPHNYILACPQFTTEQILRNELTAIDPSALVTDAEFDTFQEKSNCVQVSYFSSQREAKTIFADYLIGCDGKNSSVRQQASIHYSGKRYPDTYIMGDFEDTTSFGDDAAVFLPMEGLIECFPLPNGMRRWVVKTDAYISNPDEHILSKLVKERIGYNLVGIQHSMLSSFGVQHYVAETFTKGRILLAGDAAHVISPIGGQGMNLGWLDCWEMSNTFEKLKTSDGSITFKPAVWNEYSIYQKKITKQVARRAEINMFLGRRSRLPMLKNLFIKSLLHSPLNKKIAELFTMRGLNNWPI